MAQIYTVEDLNVKGQVIKGTEMAIRRGRGLAALCRAALDAVGGDPRLARTLVPWGRGFGANKQLTTFVFGDPPYEAERRYTEWWPWFFDAWYGNALERAEQVALANLPLTVKEKLRVTDTIIP